MSLVLEFSAFKASVGEGYPTLQTCLLFQSVFKYSTLRKEKEQQTVHLRFLIMETALSVISSC